MNIDVSLRTLESFNIGEVENAVRECFNDLRIENILYQKMKVLLKVGIPQDSHPDKAITTHPSVVSGVINVLTDLGISVVVADSPYGKFNENRLDEVYLNTGMIEVANSSKCELNRNLATTIIDNPDGVRAKSLQLLEIYN